MNTEIEIPVSELKSVLPGLAKVISRSTALPVLQCVKVSLNQEEQIISLQAHNLDEIATARLENKANGLSGQLLVPLDMLAKIVKGCAAGQSIRLISTDQETKIRYPVAGVMVDRLLTHIPPAEWPEVKQISGESILLEEDFKVAIKEAFECASEDSSRYVLNGACLDTRDKKAHYVVGTDGHHLYNANTFHFALPEPLIVPSRKFVCWPGFMQDGPWKVRMLPGVKPEEGDSKQKQEKKEVEPPWLQIDSERWSYVARGIEGTFPDWKQVVPVATANWTDIGLQETSAQVMLEAAERLPGAEEQNHPIRLVAGNGLVLKGKGRDTDWASVSIPDAAVTGKTEQVELNRHFLMKALRFGLRRIQLCNPLSPVLFSSQTKTMVVMPLRIDDAPSPVPTPAQAITPADSKPTNVSTAPPSAVEVANQETEERKTMPTTTAPATMTPPPRGNLPANNAPASSQENRPALKAALEHIERIKLNLRDVTSDLGQAVALLKAAEKEQRFSAKEIEAIRGKLREIQSVAI